MMLNFYSNINFNELFWIFLIGCFCGVVIETIWCILKNKRIESRRGLIYGPFNLVYGFGAIVMTFSLSWLDGKRDLYVFLMGAFIGGIYEYVCSIVQEKLLKTTSWDYKDFPLNLNGRINLLYCFFWGILALLWVKDLYPRICGLIRKIPEQYEYILTVSTLIFMVYNSFISACAVYRMSMRLRGVLPSNRFWKYVDKCYPDERMKRIYPNMDFSLKNF